MITGPDLATLRAALRAIQRDLDVEQPGTGRLRLVGTEAGMFVALPDGRYWPGRAVVADGEFTETVARVAEAAQECLAEILWKTWPRCPEHETGLRVGRRDSGSDGPAWECALDGGHTVAVVGELGRAARPRAARPGMRVSDGPTTGRLAQTDRQLLDDQLPDEQLPEDEAQG